MLVSYLWLLLDFIWHLYSLYCHVELEPRRPDAQTPRRPDSSEGPQSDSSRSHLRWGQIRPATIVAFEQDAAQWQLVAAKREDKSAALPCILTEKLLATCQHREYGHHSTRNSFSSLSMQNSKLEALASQFANYGILLSSDDRLTPCPNIWLVRSCERHDNSSPEILYGTCEFTSIVGGGRSSRAEGIWFLSKTLCIW
jgi:hypothetical protein